MIRSSLHMSIYQWLKLSTRLDFQSKHCGTYVHLGLKQAAWKDLYNVVCHPCVTNVYILFQLGVHCQLCSRTFRILHQALRNALLGTQVVGTEQVQCAVIFNYCAFSK